MFCIYCGKNIKDGAVFCPYCGKRLSDRQGNPQAPAAAVSGSGRGYAQMPSAPSQGGNRQESGKPRPKKRRKSPWGLLVILWLLIFLIISLSTVCVLVYFEIADIPAIRDIMVDVGIIHVEEPGEEDAEQTDPQDTEEAQTTVPEEETVPPTTENPEEVAYQEAVAYCAALAEQGNYDAAVAHLEALTQSSADPRYSELLAEYIQLRRDSILTSAADKAAVRQYRQAIQLLDAAWEKYGDAQYYDAMAAYRQEFGFYNTSVFAVGKYNTMLLASDGSIEICGDNSNGELAANYWTDIIAVGAGDRHVVGLTKDGTVVAAGETLYHQCDVSAWRNIVAISAGDLHTVGLTADGIVFAAGHNHMGQCNVNSLMSAAGEKRIVSVAAGYVHTLALLENGRVAACGNNAYGECDVSGWTDIAAIYAGTQFSAGLKLDGTVVATGQGTSGWDLSGWTDIVNLAAGDYYLIGLKEDGTVLSVSVNSSSNPSMGQTNVSGWSNIVFVAAGNDHTVALNADGKLLCIGSNKYGQCNYHERLLHP